MKGNNKNKDNKEIMSDKHFIAIITWPVLLPLLLGAVLLIGLFIGIGWMFVAMAFMAATSVAAVGILGIIGAFANISSGFGAVLIGLSCGFIGLGLIYPLFCIATGFFHGFAVLNDELCTKMKSILMRRSKE